jgi:hypothetical protein
MKERDVEFDKRMDAMTDAEFIKFWTDLYESSPIQRKITLMGNIWNLSSWTPVKIKRKKMTPPEQKVRRGQIRASSFIHKNLTMKFVLFTSVNELTEKFGNPVSALWMEKPRLTAVPINKNGKWVIVDGIKGIRPFGIHKTDTASKMEVWISPAAFKTEEEAVMFKLRGGFS